MRVLLSTDRRMFFRLFFFQAEDGIRDGTVTGVSDVCSSDLRSPNPVTPSLAASKLITRRRVGTDLVRPAIAAAFSSEVKMAAAPQSLRTKATSSAVSITLMGLTTAPARRAA